MNDRVTSYQVTQQDADFAREYHAQYERPASSPSPILTADDLLGDATNPTSTVQVASGATLTIQQNKGPQSFTVGERDPHAWVTSTKIEALERDAQGLVDQINALTNPKTGEMYPDCEGYRTKLVMQLQQVQRQALFEQTIGEQRRRAADSTREDGLRELQAEDAWRAERTQNDVARELERRFGPTVIR